ncbi:hypothetical protein MSG28_011235 [Choristoneura fumiferana]|uniref:Uncharacterized protein n=1 Tax=Choristoneura fumiferana TaxID=7141 RepID=A0ACC0KRW7_CHOFU|nr:hypothetical protein MSG28_011235 [Choristoneura fumiferana]
MALKYSKSVNIKPIYVPLLGTGLLSEQEGLGHSSHAGPVRIGNFTRTIELLRSVDTHQRKGFRNVGRQPARWKDDLVRAAGKDWMRKTHDRTEWSKMEETFTQHWVDQDLVRDDDERSEEEWAAGSAALVCSGGAHPGATRGSTCFHQRCAVRGWVNEAFLSSLIIGGSAALGRCVVLPYNV